MAHVHVGERYKNLTNIIGACKYSSNYIGYSTLSPLPPPPPPIKGQHKNKCYRVKNAEENQLEC